MESFGPEWVEDVMGAVAAVRPRKREYRNPYNRIYEAVARCRDRTQAEQLVRAVLDLRLDGQDAARAEIERLREALRPFATMAETADSDARWAWNYHGTVYELTYSHLMRAAAVLRREGE